MPAEIKRPHYVGVSKPVYADINNDPIYIMNEEEIKGLRSAANLGARTLKHAMDNTKIGMTLDDVDKLVHDYIVADGSYPSAIGFHGFVKSVCTSVNDVVSHGVPNSYRLQDGDYLNIDVVCYKDGHHGDNSAMVYLGNVHEDIIHLSETTRKAMYLAIENCRPGQSFKMIGEIIENYANEHGYHVNQEFGGHGVGKELHLPPLVHHYKTPQQRGDEMRPGMAFTIEPILMMQNEFGYYQWRDGWTI